MYGPIFYSVRVCVCTFRCHQACLFRAWQLVRVSAALLGLVCSSWPGKFDICGTYDILCMYTLFHTRRLAIAKSMIVRNLLERWLLLASPMYMNAHTYA